MGAARAAAERYSGLQAAAHWRRALALWPQVLRRRASLRCAGTRWSPASPPGARPRRQATRCRARARGRARVAETHAHLYDVAERADLLRQLARLNSSQFVGGSLGLQMIEHAIDLYRTLGPTPGLATALTWKGTELEWGGRRTEATDVLTEAAAMAAGTGDRLLERSVLAQWAWQLAASRRRGERRRDRPDHPHVRPGQSPLRNLWVGVRHTDILLMASAGAAEDVARAARLPWARPRGGRSRAGTPSILKSNVAQAWRRAGKVGRAMEVVGDETRAEAPGLSSFLHVDRAILEVLQGHEDAARGRVGRQPRRGRAGGGRQVQARGASLLRDLDGRPRGGPGADEGGPGRPARRGVSGHGRGHPGAHRGSGSGCRGHQPALGPAPRAPRARRAPRRPAPGSVQARTPYSPTGHA